MEKNSETWTFPVLPQPGQEIIPEGYIEVEVWMSEWLESEKPYKTLALWLVPVEKRYAHQAFLIQFDVTKGLGSLAEKFFRITTGKKEPPKFYELEWEADVSIGKRLLAHVKSKWVDDLYKCWITDLASRDNAEAQIIAPPGIPQNRLPELPKPGSWSGPRVLYLAELPPHGPLFNINGNAPCI